VGLLIYLHYAARMVARSQKADVKMPFVFLASSFDNDTTAAIETAVSDVATDNSSIIFSNYSVLPDVPTP
jgi:hypothetical protein